MASSKESALAIKWGTPPLGFLLGRLRIPHGPGKERPYLSTQHKVKDIENNGFFSQDEPQHKKCKHFWEGDVKKWKQPKTVDGWVNDKEEEVAPAGTLQESPTGWMSLLQSPGIFSREETMGKNKEKQQEVFGNTFGGKAHNGRV